MATNWNGKKTAINLHMNEFYIYLCILDMASAIAVAVTTAVTNSQVPEVSECVCVSGRWTGSSTRSTIWPRIVLYYRLYRVHVKPK